MTVVNSRRRRGFTLPLLEIVAAAMIIVAVVIFLTELSQFSNADRGLPFGMELGGVPVGGETPAAAITRVEQVYAQPVNLRYPITCEAAQATPCEAEIARLGYPLSCPEGDVVNCEAVIPLEPTAIGFRVNSEAMLSDAQGQTDLGSFWGRFWNYLWRKPARSASVDLQIEYSESQLRTQLEEIASRFDGPPQPARPVLTELTFVPGAPGYTLDVDASVAAADEALRRPVDRNATLVVEHGAAPDPDLQTLRELIVTYLNQPELHSLMSRWLGTSEFNAVASVFVIDLQTGEEMSVSTEFGQLEPQQFDYDIAYSGMSVVKIPIMAEMFRHINWTPSAAELDTLSNTMTSSSNFHANIMLAEIGDGSPTAGLETLDQSMQYLGLPNTFVAIEYDLEEDGPYISTEARECARAGSCVSTEADFNRQTTARDLATLLDMIYQCATAGGGGLMVAYPEEFTQTECQMMIDFMNGNKEGVLILAGVPEGTPVAHKHGWITDTHADAGIVQSPGGDYVLAMFMWADVDWLDYQVSFPLMQDISAATFNYFNPDLVNEPRIGWLGQ